MTQIAILDDYQNVAATMADWGSLGANCEATFFHDHVVNETVLVARLEPFEIIVAMRERTPFPRSVLEKLPKLRLLVTTGMRNAAIDIKGAGELGITVCGSKGLTYPTAELAWGLILSLARHIPLEDRQTRAGHWQTTLGIGLNAKTLGVIGLGTLGSRVAAYGKAFDMEVLAWSPNLTVERAAAAGAALVTKEELMARSDFITIHLVLGNTTRGIIGVQELALMKPTAYLVNTSRAPLVDYEVLYEMLHTGRIAGAGIDVFDTEPLPADDRFHGLPNVVLTPHLGYVTQETYRLWYGQVVEDIRAYLDGKPVRVLEG
jgi:phosphoglycerate dehydrogenase-like enzyme